MGRLLQPTSSISEYLQAVSAFARSFGTGTPGGVPIWVTDTIPDQSVMDGVESVYFGVRQPIHRYRFAPSPEVRAIPGVQILLDLLASEEAEAQVVPVMLFGELDLGELTKRTERVLMARSAQSLIWLLAKQFLASRDDLADLHLNAVYPESYFFSRGNAHSGIRNSASFWYPPRRFADVMAPCARICERSPAHCTPGKRCAVRICEYTRQSIGRETAMCERRALHERCR